MSGVDDLVTWLRAQLDDDERLARAATGGSWVVVTSRYTLETEVVTADVHPRWHGDTSPEPYTVVRSGDHCEPIDQDDAEHVARWSSARVLAEVDAKRKIITAIHDRKTWRSDPPAQFIDLDIETRVLELLALPYADRPGYRDEWRP